MDINFNTKAEIVKLFGKRVRATLDKGGCPDAKSPAVIAEGELLGFAQSGEFEILMDDGFVHYCWPLLDIEEVKENETN